MSIRATALSRYSIGLLLTSLLVSTACSRSEKTAAPSATVSAANFSVPPEQRDRLRVGTVTETGFRRSIRTTGTVAFYQNRSTHVVSAISGTIVDVLTPLGTKVTPGTPLATVASPDFAADVSAYRKAIVVASNLRRIADADKKLLENGNIGRRELEQADADAASADADVSAAAEQLRAIGISPSELGGVIAPKDKSGSLGVVRATMDGIVVENLVSPGELLQGGSSPVFTIADLDDMWVMADVFEADLPLVKAGESADVVPATATAPIVGKVDYVGDLVDPTTRAVSVRIVVDNKSRALKKDAYVNVVFHADEETHGIVIPVAALLIDSESLSFVFVANADGSFSRRHVTTGSRVGDTMEIKEGLKPGDQIVEDGGLFVQFAEDQ